jgi:long-chain acyl-CoA synthetase
MTKYDNLAQMFFAQAARLGPRPRYRARRQGRWHETTWQASADRVRQLAAGLLGLGIREGDRVALLSSTRPEWVEIDLAVLSIGAVTVPIYHSTLPAECGYILWDSDARVAVVENEQQAAKLRSAMTQGIVVDGVTTKHAVEHVIVIDPGTAAAPGGVEGTVEALRARGRERLATFGAEIERRIAAGRRDDVATIVYTSGTTGPPKGVVQTHGNHLASLEAVAQLGLAREGDVDFLFLPLAHSFARMLEYLGLYIGTVTAFAQSIDTLAADMAEARPDYVPAVPRVFEKIYARILTMREASSLARRFVFDGALAVGRRWSQHVQRERPVPPPLKALHAVAHLLVYKKIHRVLGGRVRYLVSGGAPLSREIAEFFHAMGILTLEGYGLTETTPVLSVNRPSAFKFGTVGRPLAGVEVRIAEDGEIIARGPNVAKGYHRRPVETAEAWDADGWFHTGDIGTIDEDGFLIITDRKKDLLKTSGGKYVAPQKIENALKNQPHVSQAVVIGDGQKYCVALITLDTDAVRAWAAARALSIGGDDELHRARAVVELIESEVAAVNRDLASFESIKYFRILPRDFTIEAGELTPSLKVKRKVVAERYRDLIDGMYRA